MRPQPMTAIDRPRVMLGFNVFAADSDEEGELIATSMQQAFVNLRTGRPSKLQPPVKGYVAHLPPPDLDHMDEQHADEERRESARSLLDQPRPRQR